MYSLMEILFDIFIITACTAERCFRVDRAQENLHYVTDIANDVIYVLDQECPTLPQTPENEMAPSLLMQPNISSLESSDKDSREGTPQSPSQKFFNRSLSGPNSVPTSESLSPGLDGGTSRKSSQGSQGSSGSAKNSLHSSRENILTGNAGNGDMNNKTWVHNEWKNLLFCSSSHRHTHTHFSPFNVSFQMQICERNAIQTESHNTADSISHNLDAFHLIWLGILSFVTVIEQTMTLTHFHPSISFRLLSFFYPHTTEVSLTTFAPQHRDRANIWQKMCSTFAKAWFTLILSTYSHVSSFHNRLFGFNEDAFGFRYYLVTNLVFCYV